MSDTPVCDSYGNGVSTQTATSNCDMRESGSIALLVCTLVLLCVGLHAQSDSGSICVAPNAAKTPQRCAPGLCAGGKLSLRIDRQPIQAWPQSESIRIGGLSTTARHRVLIYRAGKTQQSFTFRFSEFKSITPCLFLNDLYWTGQLWEGKDAPWCKCR
jgi:hypothetical protein